MKYQLLFACCLVVVMIILLSNNVSPQLKLSRQLLKSQQRENALQTLGKWEELKKAERETDSIFNLWIEERRKEKIERAKEILK